MWFSSQNFPGALNDCGSQGFVPCSRGRGDPLAMVGPAWLRLGECGPAILLYHLQRERSCMYIGWLGFFWVFLINEPSNHWLARGQKSSQLGPQHLVNRIWTETLSAGTAICCETAKCLATPSSLQSSSWRGRKAGGVRYAAGKLQIREAKRAAICTAWTTRSCTREQRRDPTAGRASTGKGRAGDGTGTAAAFPFAGQDGLLNIKKQMRLCRRFSNLGWARVSQSPVSAELRG